MFNTIRQGARLFARIAREDSGQDVIEYALLAATVGLVGLAAWPSIASTIGTAYGNWDSGIQDLSACTPDPISEGGGGCP